MLATFFRAIKYDFQQCYAGEKKGNKKEKSKNYYKLTMEKKYSGYKKYRQNIIKIFQKVKTLKKRNYANIRNENMSDSNRERRKEYMENYYYEGKHCRII